jgi:hypothetical protein
MKEMTAKDMILDLLETFREITHWTVKEMSSETLRWQPDEEANNIAVTVWHISRALDLLKVRVFENKPPEQELWHMEGWAARTRYDPRGLGWGGLGNLTGYTREEVEAVPILSLGNTLAYLDQVSEALGAYIEEMPADLLQTKPAGWPVDAPGNYAPETVYQALRDFLVDCFEHLGEIRALRAMWERIERG